MTDTTSWALGDRVVSVRGVAWIDTWGEDDGRLCSVVYVGDGPIQRHPEGGMGVMRPPEWTIDRLTAEERAAVLEAVVLLGHHDEDTPPAPPLRKDQVSLIATDGRPLDSRLPSQPLDRDQEVLRPGPIDVVCMADVNPERVTWLWPGRLPAGKLVVLDGDPGAGKSTLAVDIAARVTTGTPFADGTRTDPADVIFLSAEDGLADTIRPRCDAAGADPRRVSVLCGIREPLGDDGEYTTRPPSIPGDLVHLRALIRSTRARLVIVDVLNAFLSAKVDGHRDQDIRGALMPLARLAEETGCCIVVIRHLNKGGGNNPLYRGGGSIGIIGAARVGLMVAADPDDDQRRILAVTKCNIAREAPSLAYRLTDAEEHGCARVQWDGESSHRACDLLGGGEGSEDRSEAAVNVEWLRSYLLDQGGSAEAAPTKRAAAGLGITEKALRTARQKLGIRPAKSGLRGPWVWSLPETLPAEGAPPGIEGAQGAHTQSHGTLGTLGNPRASSDRHLRLLDDQDDGCDE